MKVTRTIRFVRVTFINKLCKPVLIRIESEGNGFVCGPRADRCGRIYRNRPGVYRVIDLSLVKTMIEYVPGVRPNTLQKTARWYRGKRNYISMTSYSRC